MKFILIVLLAAALGGCAQTPADLREKGDRAEFAMRQAPAGAAACVARNMENGNSFWGVPVTTGVREGFAPGQIELVVSYQDHYFITADFVPFQSGATAVVWVSSRVAQSLRDRLLGAFTGC